MRYTMTKYKCLGGRPLQDFYHITIDKVDDGTPGGAKVVTFHSRIHVNKANVCPVTYGTGFSDFDILHDNSLLSWVYRKYGDVMA